MENLCLHLKIINLREARLIESIQLFLIVYLLFTDAFKGVLLMLCVTGHARSNIYDVNGALKRVILAFLVLHFIILLVHNFWNLASGAIIVISTTNSLWK